MQTSLHCMKVASLVIGLLAVTVIYYTQWWTLLLPGPNAAPALAPIHSVTALPHMVSSDNAVIEGKPSQGAYYEDNVTALSKPSQGTHKKVNVTAGGKSSQPPRATDRYMIYDCDGGCGGWADRLKGIVIAYVIANLTHRRFGIRINDMPCPLREFLLPAEVPWDLPDSLDMKSDAKKYDRLGSVAFYKSMPSVNFSKVFTARVALFKANLDYFDLLKKNALYERQLQWMRPLTNDQIFARIFHQLFRPAPRVARALQAVLASARPSPDHTLLCAHVRFASNSELLRDSVRRHTTAHGHTVLRFLQSLDPASPLFNVTTATAAFPASNASAKAALPPSNASAKAALPPSNASAKAALPPSNASAKAALPPSNASAKAALPPSNASAKAALPPSNASAKAALPPSNASAKAALPPSNASAKAALPPSNASVKAGLPPSNASVKAGLPPSNASVKAALPPSNASVKAGLPPPNASAEAALSPSNAKADNYRFFVTSDSQVYIDQAGEVFGARFVRTSGQFVHVDRKGGQQGQEVCEGFTKVLVDQLLLARCDVLVVSKSGLSRQAAYIRGTDSGLYCLLMTGQLRQCQRRHLRQLYHVKG